VSSLHYILKPPTQSCLIPSTQSPMLVGFDFRRLVLLLLRRPPPSFIPHILLPPPPSSILSRHGNHSNICNCRRRHLSYVRSGPSTTLHYSFRQVRIPLDVRASHISLSHPSASNSRPVESGRCGYTADLHHREHILRQLPSVHDCGSWSPSGDARSG
jgi:hypothetical protein